MPRRYTPGQLVIDETCARVVGILIAAPRHPSRPIVAISCALAIGYIVCGYNREDDGRNDHHRSGRARVAALFYVTRPRYSWDAMGRPVPLR